MRKIGQFRRMCQICGEIYKDSPFPPNLEESVSVIGGIATLDLGSSTAGNYGVTRDPGSITVQLFEDFQTGIIEPRIQIDAVINSMAGTEIRD